MRVVFVTRCIEVPEVNTELKVDYLAVLTITTDRDDQVQACLSASLNKDVAIGRVVADRIGVAV